MNKEIDTDKIIEYVYKNMVEDNSNLVVKCLKEKDKEIERLKKEKVDLFNKSAELNMQIRESKDKEIERLNNIINELEKWLEHQWLEWRDDSSDEIAAMANEDKAVLDKLKELKNE